MQQSIPTVFTRIVLDLLAERGFHPSTILKNTGIELSAVGLPESRISLDQQLAVYNNAIEVSKLDGLGLLQGQRLLPTHLGIMGYAIQTSGNLRQALKTLVSYSPISGALLDFSLRDEETMQVLSLSNVSIEDPLRVYVIEEHIATVDSILKNITTNSFRPSRLTLEYPAPAWSELYHAHFGCDVVFNSTENSYQFDTAMFDLDIAFADPETARSCEQKCEDIINDMQAAGSYVNLIRRTILMLPCRCRKLERVAEELNISPRGLRRKLSEEETSFQAILDDVRLELATRYLENTQLPIADIGDLLGFADTAGFRRAFKRWTGRSPVQFRDAALPQDPAQDPDRQLF